VKILYPDLSSKHSTYSNIAGSSSMHRTTPLGKSELEIIVPPAM
jgi:hypothetical protein